MNLVELKCNKCGAILKVNSELNEISCNYCGNKMVIDDEATLLERMEDKKLNSRKKNHEQSLKEELDKLEISKKKHKEELKKEWLPFIIIESFCLGIPLLIWIISLINSSINPKIPSLSNYNKLEIGMSYKECRSILKVEGHRTKEKDNEMIYEWYDPDCEEGLFERCGWIVRLKFKNDKLIEREEDGLK